MIFEGGRSHGRRTPGYRRLNNLEEAMPGARSKWLNYMLVLINIIPLRVFTGQGNFFRIVIESHWKSGKNWFDRETLGKKDYFISISSLFSIVVHRWETFFLSGKIYKFTWKKENVFSGKLYEPWPLFIEQIKVFINENLVLFNTIFM